MAGCVATMMRCLQDDRFDDAARALGQFSGSRPFPPPASLWRLGRRCAKAKKLKPARHALEMFLNLYPHHEDGPSVRADLVQVLRALGRTREAQALAAPA